MRPNPTDNQSSGKKRKRYEGYKETDLDVKIGGKFHHDLKEAKKAAKKAKTFELQKLVKKLKQLRLNQSDTSSVNACELELNQLKVLDHEAVARTALKSKLLKDKLLSGNEHIQSAVLKELQSNLLASSSSGPAAKVQSRVLSSKILATEIAHIIEGLRAVVIPATDEDDMDERPAKLKKVAVDEDADIEMGSAQDDDLQDDAMSNDDGAGWESGTIGDDEKEPAEEDDDGWESGSIDGDGDEGLTDEDEDGAVPSPPKPSKTKTTTGTSTFLPSLSVGFIKGSDDSDWDEEDATAGDIPQRKNRRGQRARQAIWEKKFGRNANHKKKEAEAQALADAQRNLNRERGRGRGRGTGRGTGRGGLNRGGQDAQLPDSGWGARRDGGHVKSVAPAYTPAPAPTPAKSEALHPSWEAKKRLQEKQQMLAAAGPTTSRKIKFT